MDREILEKEKTRSKKGSVKKKNENQKGERKMSKRGILLVVLAMVLAQGNLWAQKPTLILPLKLEHTYRITIGYNGAPAPGYTYDPYHTGEASRYALDFGHPTYNLNPEIVAVANGYVETSIMTSGLGNHIIIKHANNYRTTYAHLKVRYKKEGDYVRQGEVIGLMGTTGNSTAEHLHFVLRDKDGISVLPEPMSGLTGFYPGMVISPIGMFSDGWHQASLHPHDPSQPFVDCYNDALRGGLRLTPYDNGYSAYAHFFPANGNPSSQNTMVLQDCWADNHVMHMMLSGSRQKAYVVHGQVAHVWWQNTSYYGPPLGNEFYGNYSGGVIGNSGHLLVIQKFAKIGGSIKTLVYNTNNGRAGHYPVGWFHIDSPPGAQWYEIVDNNPHNDKPWPKAGVVAPTDKWWLDAGTHNFIRHNADGSRIAGSGFTLVSIEGNEQGADPGGDPNPPPPTNFHLVLEAEEMYTLSGTGDIWWNYRIIYSNSEIYKTVNFPISQSYDFIVRAKGEYAKGWPQMILRIDNSDQATKTVASSNWQDYTFSTYVSSSNHKVALAFINDYWDEITKEDRNLFVDKITVTNFGLPPADPEPQSKLIIDEGFSNGLGVFAAEITPGIEAQIYQSSGNAVINVSQSSLQFWQVQLKTWLSVESGKKYKLTFRAKADKQRSVHLQLLRDIDPWTEYCKNWDNQLNTAWKTYEWEFQAWVNDAKARLTFHTGDELGKIYIDWVKVERISLTKPNQELAHNQPAEFQLFQNYPNPFNPTTTIKYQLPEFCQVKLIIYNISGQQIDVLINEQQNSGSHAVIWNATGSPSGIYFYTLKTEKLTQTKRMFLVK